MGYINGCMPTVRRYALPVIAITLLLAVSPSHYRTQRVTHEMRCGSETSLKGGKGHSGLDFEDIDVQTEKIFIYNSREDSNSPTLRQYPTLTDSNGL